MLMLARHGVISVLLSGNLGKRVMAVAAEKEKLCTWDLWRDSRGTNKLRNMGLEEQLLS